MQNAERSRQIARDLMKTWKLNSGFIRDTIGARLYQMPWQFVKTVDDMDALADKPELTDLELGQSLGLRLRMIYLGAQGLVKELAPDLLRYIPAIFGL